MKLNWDYTELASKYDDRADYHAGLINKVFQSHEYISKPTVLDMGAGTGKLTKELVKQDCVVIASEPNEAMRKIGEENVRKENCTWTNSPGEAINVRDKSIDSVWFGSSFNVIDHSNLIVELTRILKSNSWITCLWNHRDLKDPVQEMVENIIKSEIPGYNYGTRRQDPTPNIQEMGLFGDVIRYEDSFRVTVSKDSYIEAWKSHATLQRQCNNQEHFLELITRIEGALSNSRELEVPYVTRLWTAKSKAV
jgi:ubiquinone/menaquinone biosynthesis C-methylase UbiE